MLGASQEREASSSPWSHPVHSAQTLTVVMVVVVVVTMSPSICWEQRFSTLAAHWNLLRHFLKMPYQNPTLNQLF